MPQGVIHTKQCWLSGHWWVHGFNFTFWFYAISIPTEDHPDLAYYIKGRDFFTQNWMPFSLTGAPSTFAHVTANKLGDLLVKLEIELLVNDGGMAGDDFDNMMNCTHCFFEWVWETSLSLSAKKSEFFMTKIIFAGSWVGPDGVQVDNMKLMAMVNWHQPPHLLNLSSF